MTAQRATPSRTRRGGARPARTTSNSPARRTESRKRARTSAARSSTVAHKSWVFAAMRRSSSQLLDQDARRRQHMTLVIDPVCGQQFDSADAVAQSQYQGKTYYFDATECQDRFEDDPPRYANHPTGDQGRATHAVGDRNTSIA